MPTRGSVLVDTPLTNKLWNDAIVEDPKSGVGISGTHTALLGAANAFAAEGWHTYVAGSVTAPPAAGRRVKNNPLEYVHVEDRKQPPRINATDFTIVANLLKQTKVFARVDTAHLAVLMEMQSFPPADEETLRRYVDAQRARYPGFRVTFCHLSSWGRDALKRWVARSDDSKRLNGWMSPALSPTAGSSWVRHVDFFNPVSLRWVRRAHEDAVQQRLVRNEHSFLFPACLERGGAMAARVYAALRPRWQRNGMNPTATFASYATSRLSIEEEVAIKRHAGTSSDVVITGMSKTRLMRQMQVSGFFVYALVSKRGAVHLDTFANVIAECLAAGVLVLVPPVAALTELFAGLVTFVTPPGGSMPAAFASAIKPPIVPELNSQAMMRQYVAAIDLLMANATRREELRERGRRGVAAKFGERRAMRALYQKLTLRSVMSVEKTHSTELKNPGFLERLSWLRSRNRRGARSEEEKTTRI